MSAPGNLFTERDECLWRRLFACAAAPGSSISLSYNYQSGARISSRASPKGLGLLLPLAGGDFFFSPFCGKSNVPSNTNIGTIAIAHKRTYARTYAFTHNARYTYTHTGTHTHIHARIHKYTHVHTFIYARMCVCV